MNHFAIQAIFNKPVRPRAIDTTVSTKAPKAPRKQRPSIPPARELLEQQAKLKEL